MKLKEVVAGGEWASRPQRMRRVSPEIREIVRAAGRSKAGQWVVVSLTDDEKKRQPTLRGRIQAAAVQAGFKVKFEMRNGDLGVQKES